jgi:hypothetical protein
MLISPEWVVLVKLYTMKALWPYRYERRGGPRRADYNQQILESMKVSDELVSRDMRDRDRAEESETMLRVLRS